VRVVVRLFAVLREEAGADRVELDVAPGATAEDVWRGLVERHPPLAARRASLTAAVNRRYAPWGEPVAAGDEVAFIPPVSGG
jgi:molybdopterin synthase catalytic subunit